MKKYTGYRYRDTLGYLYKRLNYAVRNGIEGKKIYAYLQHQVFKPQEPKAGDFAADFIEKDINGEEVRLSSYFGKGYVLLDF